MPPLPSLPLSLSAPQQEIRKYLARIRADEALVLLLLQENRQIAYGAAGVLVNVAPHAEGKDVLVRSNFEGIRNLCDLLDRSTETVEVECRDGGGAREWVDVQMAIVVGHVLHNFCLADGGSVPELPFALRKRVLTTLASLQEEAAVLGKSGGGDEYIGFANVADRLRACVKALPVISASGEGTVAEVAQEQVWEALDEGEEAEKDTEGKQQDGGEEEVDEVDADDGEEGGQEEDDEEDEVGHNKTKHK